jgi:hypothetical protein
MRTKHRLVRSEVKRPCGVRLPASWIKILAELARSNERSMAAEIRLALRRYLEAEVDKPRAETGSKS